MLQSPSPSEVLIAAALFLGLVGALAIAWNLGAWTSRRHARLGQARAVQAVSQHPQLGVVQGAILGLLGLLLGFAFSGAMGRFIERQDILVRESNAIGTAFLRAGLLPPPHAQEVRASLHEYAKARLELFEAVSPRDEARVQERLRELHDRLWSQAAAGTQAAADRPALAGLVLAPVNDVIDLLAVRNAATRRHMPPVIYAILMASACAAVASIGFGVESGDRRLRTPALILAFLIASTLWATMDLDYPRMGLIRVNDAALRNAAAATAIDATAVAPR